MTSWKKAAAAAAVLAAAGLGSSLAPVAHGQARTAPARADVFTFGSGRIGVSVSDVDAGSTAKTASGVLIESVDEGSPAEKAGIKKGDVVVEFDGERVRSVRQFTRLVSETPVGRTVAAAVQRDGQRVTVNLTPADGRWGLSGRGWQSFEGDARRAVEDALAMRVMPRADVTVPRVFEYALSGGTQLGVTTGELTPQLAEYFGAKDGVLVESVREDSAGAKAGLKAGDVITGVNGTTVDTASELRRQLSRIERGQEFSLSILRDKKTMTLKGKTEPPASRRSTTRTIL